MQVTFQERDTDMDTLMDMVLFGTTTVAALEGVQSGARLIVNVTSAFAVGSGPLL